MVSTFVLINAETETESGVLKELRGIQNVKEANLVYGSYDIIAKFETKDIDELKEVMVRKRALTKKGKIFD